MNWVTPDRARRAVDYRLHDDRPASLGAGTAPRLLPGRAMTPVEGKTKTGLAGVLSVAEERWTRRLPDQNREFWDDEVKRTGRRARRLARDSDPDELVILDELQPNCCRPWRNSPERSAPNIRACFFTAGISPHSCAIAVSDMKPWRNARRHSARRLASSAKTIP